MNGKSKPYAILIFGAPMCGKTTFATQFSKRFDAPFLNLAEMRAQHHISRKLALTLIREFAKCKQTFIIEGALDSEKQRDEIRKTLVAAGYDAVLVWIQTDVGAIKQRMRKKYRTLSEAKEALEASYAKLEAPDESEFPLVISGKHTFQTQCKNVLAALAERKTRK